MKLIATLVVGTVAAAAVAGFTPCRLLSVCTGGGCPVTDEPQPPGGRYLEVRSITVFGGACHFNGEVASQGRQALLAWSFDGGTWNDVDLDGVTVAAAVSSDKNLDEGRARRSLVYVDEAVSPARREAAVAWLQAHASEALGEIAAVEAVALELSLDGGSYALRVPDVLAVEGTAMADAACCTMPELRWCEPLAAETDATVVGKSSTCRFAGARGLPRWSYADANNAFVGRFCAPAPDCRVAVALDALSE